MSTFEISRTITYYNIYMKTLIQTITESNNEGCTFNEDSKIYDVFKTMYSKNRDGMQKLSHTLTFFQFMEYMFDKNAWKTTSIQQILTDGKYNDVSQITIYNVFHLMSIVCNLDYDKLCDKYDENVTSV